MYRKKKKKNNGMWPILVLVFQRLSTKLSILDILEGLGNLRHQIIHLFSVFDVTF